jgi:hypothetical protein
MLISCDFIPTKDITRVVASEGAEIEKCPSTFVTVPIVVPLTIMVAPIKGIPFSSLTMPEITFGWLFPFAGIKSILNKRYRKTIFSLRTLSFPTGEHIPLGFVFIKIRMFIREILILFKQLHN